MKAFLTPLQGLAEFEQICEKGKKNKGVLQVSGCLESQKAHLIYGLCQLAPFRLILAEDERRAREIYEDYRFYDKKIYLYSASLSSFNLEPITQRRPVYSGAPSRISVSSGTISK